MENDRLYTIICNTFYRIYTMTDVVSKIDVLHRGKELTYKEYVEVLQKQNALMVEAFELIKTRDYDDQIDTDKYATDQHNFGGYTTVDDLIKTILRRCEHIK